MVTYKTLEVFLAKVFDAIEQVKKVYKDKSEHKELLEEDLRLMAEQLIALEAQKETIQQLMDTENNPPMSELPFAGDDIEELFDKRLEGPEGLSLEEVHKDRQEGVYLKESLDMIEQLDILNEATKETSSGESPEVGT